MKKLILATLILAVSTPALAGEEPDSYFKGLSRHQDWTVLASIDSFSGEMTDIATQQRIGDHGGITVVCSTGGKLSIQAKVNNQFTDTIGGMMTPGPILVKYKVGGTLYTGEGKWPNYLLKAKMDIDEFIAAARAGDNMKIRTTHGEELHTWNISLRGFTAAINKTLAMCKELK
ncbi:MAG: hypothetical protein COB27_004595 [Moritella sp.]|uniref:hypothetical protein n=1 Tax=Moritella sp. TaxID=78556 RepID=UPI00216CCD27|nr:hypothetical protein [Moritella sp.]MBL1416139.1 hypothetical protein [Moritella sp.]